MAISQVFDNDLLFPQHDDKEDNHHQHNINISHVISSQKLLMNSSEAKKLIFRIRFNCQILFRKSVLG